MVEDDLKTTILWRSSCGSFLVYLLKIVSLFFEGHIKVIC